MQPGRHEVADAVVVAGADHGCRTRGALALQRWLFGLAITFTALTFATRIGFDDHRITMFRLLILDYAGEFGICLALALGFWIAYHALRGRLNGSGG